MPIPEEQQMREMQRTAVALTLAIDRGDEAAFDALFPAATGNPAGFIASACGLIRGLANALAVQQGMDLETFLQGFLQFSLGQEPTEDSGGE